MAIKYKVVEYKNDDKPWSVYYSKDDIRKEPDTESLRKGDTDSETNVCSSQPASSRNNGNEVAKVLNENSLEEDNTTPTVQSQSEHSHSSYCYTDDQQKDVHEPNDPVLFINKRVTGDVIDFLVNRPCQPSKYEFPQTNGRSFKEEWFVNTPSASSGSCKTRPWLSYSKSRDSVYCLTCLLFGGPSADSGWTLRGFTGWHSGHGLRGIERHESSSSHRQAEVVRFQWQSKCRMDRSLIEKNMLAVKQNRRVMYHNQNNEVFSY